MCLAKYTQKKGKKERKWATSKFKAPCHVSGETEGVIVILQNQSTQEIV